MTPGFLRDLLRELADGTPLTVVAGAGLGAGLTQWLVGPLGQRSDLSIEALAQIGLQVFGPLGVCLIGISRTAALRVSAQRPWPQALGGAALGAMALLPYFLLAMLMAGMGITPRSDLGSEVNRLMGELSPSDLLQSLLRTGFFAAATAAVCVRKARQLRRDPDALPRLVADAITEAFLVVIALEALWLILLDPLHVSLR